ncbi:apolipoprotein N-acyltransferase [Rhizosphaericola mali]|uniref:Apolipoprotein N-acyltransferase n=1 Tax=Rhizosphaericola mali TaxID=2545455 RepID=A0A5P2G510_9BACT|nr:apolipoprotein N-acyltransferase [Rhizosphaericola mali]QES90277.1 apolipoprotein N-acyltransferase [Rhizosphaericola mali]
MKKKLPKIDQVAFAKKHNRKMNWLAALAAIPITFGIQMISTPFNWLILVPIFYLCLDATKRQILTRAVIFGVTASVINFNWLINSVANYSKTGYLFGIGLIIAFAIFFSLYTSLVGLVYYYLLPKNRHYKSYWIWAAIAGGCFGVLLDWSMEHIGRSFATCLYLNYIPASTNLYAIQPASIFGPYIITFFGAMLNYLVAEFIKVKKWKLLVITFVCILIYLAWGALILNNYQQNLVNNPKKDSSFKAAIICENLLPDESWNSTNGDLVAKQLFALTQVAIKNQARLGIWTETAIPWTYDPDDNFINFVDSLSSPSGMTNLIGVNTVYAKNVLLNSIYSIAPGKKVLGRYDKRVALSLAEKPFLGITMPFFYYGNIQYKEGVSDKPLNTPVGKAGMMLCNESVITDPSWSSVKEGANFLINPGNDGWFAQTYLSRQHFYYDRMRAVETRKDVVVNNNNGYCGIIKSTGEIEVMENNDGPKTIMVDISPNSFLPSSLIMSNYLVIFSFLLFISISIWNIKVIKNYK